MTKFSKIDEKLSQIKSIYDHDNSIKDGPLGRKIQSWDLIVSFQKYQLFISDKLHLFFQDK